MSDLNHCCAMLFSPESQSSLHIFAQVAKALSNEPINFILLLPRQFCTHPLCESLWLYEAADIVQWRVIDAYWVSYIFMIDLLILPKGDHVAFIKNIAVELGLTIITEQPDFSEQYHHNALSCSGFSVDSLKFHIQHALHSKMNPEPAIFL